MSIFASSKKESAPPTKKGSVREKGKEKGGSMICVLGPGKKRKKGINLYRRKKEKGEREMHCHYLSGSLQVKKKKELLGEQGGRRAIGAHSYLALGKTSPFSWRKGDLQGGKEASRSPLPHEKSPIFLLRGRKREWGAGRERKKKKKEKKQFLFPNPDQKLLKRDYIATIIREKRGRDKDLKRPSACK